MRDLNCYKEKISDMLIQASNGLREKFELIVFTINKDFEIIFVVKEISDNAYEFVEDIVVDLEVIVASEKISKDNRLGLLMDDIKWNVKVVEKYDFKETEGHTIVFSKN